MRIFLVALIFCLFLAPSAKGFSFGDQEEPAKGTVTKGHATAPSNAPYVVKQVIKAANRIRRKPYIWGGGHGMSGDSWPIQKGYDCSGAVSYALWGGGLTDRSRTSEEYLSFGKRGKGEWITIWTNDEHVFLIVAGMRWDTAGGRGPRWHKDMRSVKGFKARTIPGY